MVTTVRKINRTCLYCKQDYEDTQIIINGIPDYRSNICPDCLKDDKYMDKIMKELNDGTNK